LARIAGLYRIEAEAEAMTVEARHAHRQQHAVPELQALKAWLDELRPQGNSAAARAIDSTLRRWAALARYVADDAHPIDNNPIENAIRPIAGGPQELAVRRIGNRRSPGGGDHEPAGDGPGLF